MFDLGDVLSVPWDDRPIRIVATDPVETFYDVRWPGGDWGLRRIRSAVYYRLPTPFVMDKALVVGREPLLPNELNLHRPDLPLRLLRSAECSWSDTPDVLTARTGASQAEIVLQAPVLALEPYGPKGDSAKTVLVEATDGEAFTSLGLLLLAQEAQSACCPEVRGIGMYRSGIRGGVPSYYLWGASDRAGNAV